MIRPVQARCGVLGFGVEPVSFLVGNDVDGIHLGTDRPSLGRQPTREAFDHASLITSHHDKVSQERQLRRVSPATRTARVGARYLTWRATEGPMGARTSTNPHGGLFHQSRNRLDASAIHCTKGTGYQAQQDPSRPVASRMIRLDRGVIRGATGIRCVLPRDLVLQHRRGSQTLRSPNAFGRRVLTPRPSTDSRRGAAAGDAGELVD